MTKADKELDNIIDNINAIEGNTRTLRDILTSRGGWEGASADERKRLLMELRHDFEDALKSIRALEGGD
jgi:Fic family protein